MNYQLLLILCLQISIMNGAPLVLMPVPWMAPSPQQIVLQEQLMELQALQELSAQSSQMYNQHQPLMILLPKQESMPNINSNEHDTINKENDPFPSNFENNDELNSVVIDAASETNENQNPTIPPIPQRAILLIPNARLSIGGIVSAIPWLPIEINVPDTIAWAYNGIVSGIGSIISIIGRPFQGTQTRIKEEALKTLLKQMQPKQNMIMPIVMTPINGPVLPIQV